MGLLALAMAPGIAICLFIYFKDKYNREPLGLLILSFFMGVLSIIPAIILQMALTKPVEKLMGEGVFYTAVFSYLIVALSEEGSKFLALRRIGTLVLRDDSAFSPAPRYGSNERRELAL